MQKAESLAHCGVSQGASILLRGSAAPVLAPAEGSRFGGCPEYASSVIILRMQMPCSCLELQVQDASCGHDFTQASHLTHVLSELIKLDCVPPL